MATYRITDNKSGKTYRITGDRPPTEQEINQIVSQDSQQTAPQPQGPLSSLDQMGKNFQGGLATASRELGFGINADQQAITHQLGLALKGALTGKPTEVSPMWSQTQKEEWKRSPIEAIGKSAVRDVAGFLPWLMGSGEIKALSKIPLIGKIAGPAIGRFGGGLIQGGLTGVSQEGATPGSVESSALIGAGLNTILGPLAQKVPEIGRLIRGGGKRIMEPIAGRTVGPTASWATKESDIAEKVLEETKGFSPRSIAKNIEDTLTKVSTKIDETLKGMVGDRFKINFFGENGLEDQLNKSVSENIPGFDLKRVRGSEAGSALEQVKNIIIKKAKSGAEAFSSHMYPYDLYKAKQEIGDKLKQLKVFSRLNNNQAITDAESVWLNAYGFLKDKVDSFFEKGSAVGNLTQMEHELMIASESLHDIAHTGSQKYLQPRNIVGSLQSLTGLLTPLEVLTSRGMYEGGAKIENVIKKMGGEKLVGDLLRKIMIKSGSDVTGRITSQGNYEQ